MKLFRLDMVLCQQSWNQQTSPPPPTQWASLKPEQDKGKGRALYPPRSIPPMGEGARPKHSSLQVLFSEAWAWKAKAIGQVTEAANGFGILREMRGKSTPVPPKHPTSPSIHPDRRGCNPLRNGEVEANPQPKKRFEGLKQCNLTLKRIHNGPS